MLPANNKRSSVTSHELFISLVTNRNSIHKVIESSELCRPNVATTNSRNSIAWRHNFYIKTQVHEPRVKWAFSPSYRHINRPNCVIIKKAANLTFRELSTVVFHGDFYFPDCFIPLWKAWWLITIELVTFANAKDGWFSAMLILKSQNRRNVDRRLRL